MTLPRPYRILPNRLLTPRFQPTWLTKRLYQRRMRKVPRVMSRERRRPASRTGMWRFPPSQKD